jgi:hypothetical protein
VSLFLHILKSSIISLRKLIVKPIENNDPMPSPNFEFPVFEMEKEDDEEIPDELSRLLEHEEKTIQPHKEPLEVINLGFKDNKKEVKIWALLCPDVKKMMVELLREYVDVFSWSYQDMPGLDTYIV